MSIRALIVDDEPWARTRIASLLATEPDFTLLEPCASGAEAIRAIVDEAPQVVFLDVRMPDIDGFEVVDAIGVDAMPLVVFATAFEDYALRAFDAGALDYLLKPFDEERFRRAVERVRREVLAPAGAVAALGGVMADLRRARGHAERLVIHTSGRVVFLKVEEIDWLEASGNYVLVHAGREKLLMRETLRALVERLDPARFVRLHRSAVVNIERLRELLPWSRGEQVAVLLDGTQLTIGRAFRERLLAVMNGQGRRSTSRPAGTPARR
jgi:two-component system, LytTR family, response regulator